MTCPGCGGQIVATRTAVIDSWRRAAKLYGVIAIWAGVILVSLIVPWAKTKESGLLTAALLGWLPGCFPGMLVTTFLGSAIGHAVANSVGANETGDARPSPAANSSADRDLRRPECYFCGKALQSDETTSRVCRTCRV